MNAGKVLVISSVLLFLGCSSSHGDTFVKDPHPAWDTYSQVHPVEFNNNPTSCAGCHGSTADPASQGGTSRTSCYECHSPSTHATSASCASCHPTQQNQWASSLNLHAASTAEVLTNVDHNMAELLNDDCVKCHASFQVPLGVAHFVTPVDQVGQPAGVWTALNPGDWQATKCEVCHDPSATNPCKLAKYGALLDGSWTAGYIPISDLPAAYQAVISTTGAASIVTYADQTTLAVQATKLCNSCHDPADQGGDPNVVVGGVDYGPQGGDSRAYVTSSHRGLGCIDCHPTHDFTPTQPETTASCGGSGCHSTARSGSLPGKVHVNHL